MRSRWKRYACRSLVFSPQCPFGTDVSCCYGVRLDARTLARLEHVLVGRMAFSHEGIGVPLSTGHATSDDGGRHLAVHRVVENVVMPAGKLLELQRFQLLGVGRHGADGSDGCRRRRARRASAPSGRAGRGRTGPMLCRVPPPAARRRRTPVDRSRASRGRTGPRSARDDTCAVAVGRLQQSRQGHHRTERMARSEEREPRAFALGGLGQRVGEIRPVGDGTEVTARAGAEPVAEQRPVTRGSNP